MAFPHNATDVSAVCESGIFLSYTVTIFIYLNVLIIVPMALKSLSYSLGTLLYKVYYVFESHFLPTHQVLPSLVFFPSIVIVYI